MIYTISDEAVIQLDPSNWIETSLSDIVPDDDLGHHKCVGTNIGGSPVIFTLKGNIFNLDTNQWEEQVDIPQQTYLSNHNSMWSYNNRPTIFGAPFVNALNEISYHNIIQYIEEDQEWILLGDMNEPRRFHEAVEVPNSYCDILDDITTVSPPTTTTTELTTTDEPPREETAALIIGGYVYGPDADITDAVELFGCDGGSQFLAPLENRNAFMGATFVDDEDGGYVLACGGTQCIDNRCAISDLCYEWRPQTNVWEQTSVLTQDR